MCHAIGGKSCAENTNAALASRNRSIARASAVAAKRAHQRVGREERRRRDEQVEADPPREELQRRRQDQQRQRVQQERERRPRAREVVVRDLPAHHPPRTRRARSPRPRPRARSGAKTEHVDHGQSEEDRGREPSQRAERVALGGVGRHAGMMPCPRRGPDRYPAPSRARSSVGLERGTSNPQVGGSIPPGRARITRCVAHLRDAIAARALNHGAAWCGRRCSVRNEHLPAW